MSALLSPKMVKQNMASILRLNFDEMQNLNVWGNKEFCNEYCTPLSWLDKQWFFVFLFVYHTAGQCLANSLISDQHLVPYQSLWENPYVIACIVLLCLLVSSLMCNIALLCFRCTCKCSSRPMTCNSPRKSDKVAYHPVNLFQAFEDEDSSSLWPNQSL